MNTVIYYIIITVFIVQIDLAKNVFSVYTFSRAVIPGGHGEWGHGPSFFVAGLLEKCSKFDENHNFSIFLPAANISSSTFPARHFQLDIYVTLNCFDHCNLLLSGALNNINFQKNSGASP